MTNPNIIAPSWHESTLEELKNRWSDRNKELTTLKFQPYIDRYLLNFFNVEGSKTIFESLKTAISKAITKEDLSITIFDYFHTVVTKDDLTWPFVDKSGKHWNQLHMFIDANNYETRVEGSYVDVDMLVRKTTLLKQIDALFGRSNFRVKVERTTFIWNEKFVVEMCEFVLDYFPDGVPEYMKR
jgi:hypothetical protein